MNVWKLKITIITTATANTTESHTSEVSIARISPKTGSVVGWIDLSGILNPRVYPAEVLNGIAYDPQRNRLFVTGKYWPLLFEIELVRAP